MTAVLPYVLVDVFTDRPLFGNPVAVFTHADGLNDATMQRIAREMNLSETTFVFHDAVDTDVRVQIFTPVNELPFAGHPTLGTAMALGHETLASGLTMKTKVGDIPFTFERNSHGSVTRVTMRQPMPTFETYADGELVLSALGLTASTLPVDLYVNGPRHVFVGVETIEALSNIRPDLRAIAHLPDVAFNCFAGAADRWRMRMFSPAYGVSEDSGTGSAASPLLLHLIRHGRRQIGDSITIEQGVEMGRHSVMQARSVPQAGQNGDGLELFVAGACVVVGRGQLLNWT